MKGAGKWPIIVTLAVIFGGGLVVGLWLNRKSVPSPVLVQPAPSYTPFESGEAVVMQVYKALSPTVVNIVATSLTWNFWLQPEPRGGQGTGFVIDEQGNILTNNHVVANAENLEVTFIGGKKVRARLVGRDSVSDLAVIKVDPFSGMAVAPLGDSDKLAVGQRVIAIGNPFGLQHTATAGFISALNRDIAVGDHTMMGLIQTDAAINQGNSGGPLIDSRGEVIGVNNALYTPTGSFVGIGLAVPINQAKKVAAQIIKFGRAIYPWLGIKSGRNVDPNLATQMGLPAIRGILIYELVPGSPAAKAGLRGGDRLAFYGPSAILLGGDVIVSVDGTPTPTLDAFNNMVLQKNVGDTVRVGLQRGPQQLTVDVKTTADPGNQQ
ncbi:MAG TPA: trypsin-like peptidase domain-containing protein [Desulfomonilaceae bacterium]|nr:trypsin-like peptidase domain-containing protein [Desulfomonilaceae bacterium]